MNWILRHFTKPTNAAWLIGVVVFAISFGSHFRAGTADFWKDTIASDGRGYYAYLPSIVLHGEFGFEQVLLREKQVYPAMMAGTFVTDVDGNPVNKYFAGAALLIFPFFLLAIFFSIIAGFPINGYNAIFQLMVSIAGIFYLIAGLNFTRKLLQKFNVGEGVATITLWTVVFGSNLLIYVVDAPAMSHVFSFAAVAGFMFYVKSFFDSNKAPDALFAAFFLGIIVLIRPVNGIVVLLIPFLSGNFGTLISAWQNFFRAKKIWIPAVTIIFILLLIQPLLWHLQTGYWWVWSYQGEGFNFAQPEIVNVLFSYQKGLFVYTPVFALSLFGLTSFFKKNKWQFYWLICFLTVLVWLVASWWNWYYGDSFGQRVFIDFFALMALLMATLLENCRHHLAKISLLTFVLALSAINLVQTWQYAHGIIHPYAMNKAKYWHVFLKTDEKYRNLFRGPVDIPPFKTDFSKTLRDYFNDFEQEQTRWITSGRVQSFNSKSGEFVAELNQNQPYSSALAVTGDTLLIRRSDMYAKIEAYIFDQDNMASATTKLVVSLTNKSGENYYLNSWDVNETPTTGFGFWRKIEFGFQLPKIIENGDEMKIYFWQSGAGTVLFDNFGIKIYGRKN